MFTCCSAPIFKTPFLTNVHTVWSWGARKYTFLPPTSPVSICLYSSSVMVPLRLHLFHCLIHFSFRCHLSHQVADLTDHLTGESIWRPIGRWMTKNAPNILLVPYVPQTIVPIHQNVAWNGTRQDQKVKLLLWNGDKNGACHTRCCHHWLHLICFLVV